MTFGKDQNGKLEGFKGGKSWSDVRNLKLSIALKKKWKDPEYRNHHIKTINEINARKTKKDFSEMGKKSRFYENLIGKKFVSKFDIMFKPYEVCDRICIKNGEIFFLEIKNKNNQRLTDKQRLFKNIAREKFIMEVG